MFPDFADLHFDLAQTIGIIASAAIISAFNMKCDVRLKILIATGNTLFAIHFLLLGAHAGAVVAVINIFRAVFAIKFHKSTSIMLMFMFAYITMAFVTYESWVTILPFISGVLGSFALFKLSGIPLRLCVLGGSTMWMTHNIIFMSIGGIITECFVISVMCITIYRLFKDMEKHEQNRRPL